MSLVVWIVLGLVAGLVAGKLVNRSGQGMALDVMLGMIGAVLGGWLFRAFGSAGPSSVDLYSLLVAAAGAVLLMFAYRALARGAD